MSAVGRLLAVLGVLLLLQAGYSTFQYRELSKSLGVLPGALPLDVYVELALSFALCLAGAIALADGFKPIFSTDEAPMNSFHRLFGPRPDTAKM